MRRFIDILVSFIAIVAFFSCTDFQEEEIPAGLSVNVNELSFASTQSTQSATVSCGVKWDVVSIPSWISVGTIRPSGMSPYEWTIDFSASTNEDYTREGTIVFRAQSETKEISVIQEGKKGKYIAVESISVSPAELSLIEGENASLAFVISPSNASIKDVTWKSSNPSVATISLSGRVDAIATGKTVITVTTEDGGKSASCSVTVSPVSVSSVTLDKESLVLKIGETSSLTATVLPENAANKKVSWSSSNTGVATVDQNGKVTGIGVGSAKITVTTEDGGKKATCSVTVNAITVTGVSLNKSSMTLLIGGTEQLVATVTPSNATNKNVVWSSSNASVATVDSNGNVSAIKVGTAIITATTEDGGKKATCSVTVNPIAVTDVTLNQTSITMTVGDTQTLTATVTPSNATDKSVTWSSSNTSIATVSSSGVVTAKAAGSATITVTTNDGGKKATCSVTVQAQTVAVTGVSLDKTSLSMTVGDTQTLTATVTPSNATDKSVTWSSSNTSIATVSSSGIVTAKAAGSATITVTTNDGGKTATCSVTVQAQTVAVTGVSLNKTSLSMTVGDTQTLTATVTPSNATDKSVTWSSSNTSIATVSSSGVVTAKAAGSATITVTTNDGGKKATCSVTVQAQTVSVTGVSLDKTSLSMTVGDTQSLTATVTPSNATDKSVTWSSSNSSVATVSTSGVVTAKAAGSATITVTTNDGGKTATCSVTVQAQVVAVTGVSLDKTSMTMTEGDTQTLTATITPSNATNKTVTWSSSNTSVATVSSSGVVTAKSAGSATITVTTVDGGIKATCSVTVIAKTVAVTGVSLDKTNLNMVEGDTQSLTATVTPSDATDKTVTWSSSNTSIATVSSSGVVTAKAAGSAIITVKTNDGNKTATCSVTVTAKTVSVTGVSLNKTSLSMTVGDTQTLVVTVTPSNATDKSVTWSSNKTSVATVSSSGVITAKSAGAAIITVTTNDGGKTATCSVTVKAKDNYNYPNNSIHGAFSVSSTKKVCFARANVTRYGSLLDYQYSVRSSSYNGNDVTDGYIDLAEYDASQIIKSSSDLGESWRLLSKEEWTYLIDERKNSDKKFYVRISDRGGWGMLLAPDDWVVPDDFGYEPWNAETGGVYYIPYEEFLSFEEMGFVFLPQVQSIVAQPYGTGYRYLAQDSGDTSRYALSDPITVTTGTWNKKVYYGYRLNVANLTIVNDRYDYNYSVATYGTMFSAVRAAYDL